MVINQRNAFRAIFILFILITAIVFCAGTWPRIIIAGEEAFVSYKIQADGTVFSPTWGQIYIVVDLILNFFFVSSYVFTGILIFRAKQNSGIALFLSLMLIALAVSESTIPDRVQISNKQGRLEGYPLGLLVESMDGVSVVAALVILYIFPNGSFVPKWTKKATVIWCGMAVIWLIFPFMPFNPIYGFTWDRTPVLSLGVFLVVIASGIYAQIYRWRHESDSIERQQVKWVLFGFILTIVAGVIRFFPPGPGETPIILRLVRTTVATFLAVGLPVTISIAVRRHQLWELPRIINLTIVWTIMTTIVIIIFVVLVGVLGNALGISSSPVLSAATTALVAVSFQPLRIRVQDIINRYIFGWNDPLEVMKRLVEQHQSTHTPDQLLKSIVVTIAEMLKLPYVAIEIEEDGVKNTIVSHGHITLNVSPLPLIYQEKEIGNLIIAPRDSGEVFRSSDNRLLEIVSWQTAVVVQIYVDLQRSRERLVRATERDRQRLQRDLHDRLGATLSAQIMKLGLVQVQLFQKPEQAVQTLNDVETALIQISADIRQLIHGLRPPALDHVGILRVIQLMVEEYRKPGFKVTFESPDELPVLPPAVDSAIYFITQTAITNVVRHANATECQIVISVNEQLHLNIKDNGIGMPKEYQSGLGLRSIRDRAEELGGEFQIISEPRKGTLIEVKLPLDLKL